MTVQNKVKQQIARAQRLARRLKGVSPTAEYMDRVQLNLLRNRHLGQRCFVIGNGPSLLADDLERLRFEYTFASNKIYLIFGDTGWRPTYYSVEDVLVATQNAAEIEEVTGCTKLFPLWVMYHTNRRFSEGVYFELVSEDKNGPDFPKFSTDPLKFLYWGSTIIYTQIQLACFMGFKDIILLGVDFDYQVPSKGPDGIVLTSEGEVNHFHKNYRKPGEKWHVPNLDIHTKSFTVARRESERQGVTIRNATRGGKLEIFERVAFDSLFE